MVEVERDDERFYSNPKNNLPNHPWEAPRDPNEDKYISGSPKKHFYSLPEQLRREAERLPPSIPMSPSLHPELQRPIIRDTRQENLYNDDRIS